MRRRAGSKSSQRPKATGSSPRKLCSNCLIKSINCMQITRSLSRKYSHSVNHLFLTRINSIQP